MTFEEFYSQPKYKRLQVKELYEWEDIHDEGEVERIVVPLAGLKNLAREAYKAGFDQGSKDKQT